MTEPSSLYGKLLQRALLPGWERLRGRPTFELLQFLQRTERASLDELHAIQTGLLRRLVRHAANHSPYYRERFADLGIAAGDIQAVGDVERLPKMTRAEAQQSYESRVAEFPPIAVHKTTSGTTGEPVRIAYNAESRHWRDAMRWRGYGWAGYAPGMRALHFWGQMYAKKKGIRQLKVEVDHALRNDLYVDCGPRAPADLDRVTRIVRTRKPEVIVAYAQGAVALARYVNSNGLRDWDTIPVICGAEKIFPDDRTQLETAFGPAVYETYGCREFMLIGTECEMHDGFHASMETLIVEILVPDGSGWRAARPGEEGQVAVTDLTNLACPFIRYLTGDMAVARTPDACACGRTLMRFGPVQGRISETMRNLRGEPVNGMTFAPIFVELADHVKQFQVHQRASGDLTLRIVESSIGLTADAERRLREHVSRYLPGTQMVIERVAEIPLTATGKRRVVIVDPPA